METPPAAPEPNELAPYVPSPAPAPRPAAPAQPRRNRLWYASLLVAVVVTLGGLGLLYLDDVSWQRQAGDLSRQNSSLHEQLLTSQGSLTTAQKTIQDLKTAAQNPTLGMWNLPQTIDGPDWSLINNVPDTFTYHLHATSTGPMSVSILTLEQFATALDCVHNGLGRTNDCMHIKPTVVSWLNVRSVDYDFHLAEGCADYMVVFTSSERVTVTPNVSVTYNPSNTVTGVCAG
ncbi:MAG TPA: hypothetical protein VFL29_02570 [Candidatus Dormibacteraeota bacterium]|nr:hypothetical protein [Candidatus Dormibacteraeota bacterium]